MEESVGECTIEAEATQQKSEPPTKQAKLLTGDYAKPGTSKEVQYYIIEDSALVKNQTEAILLGQSMTRTVYTKS